MTIKELINNYVIPKNSYKEPNRKKLNMKHNANIKSSKNNDLETKSSRKPHYFNVRKNNFEKKPIKSNSRTKKALKQKINKMYLYDMAYSPDVNITNNSKALNKTIYHDSLALSKHERNLSAPSLKCKKDENSNSIIEPINQKTKHKIIKIKQNNNNNYLITNDENSTPYNNYNTENNTDYDNNNYSTNQTKNKKIIKKEDNEQQPENPIRIKYFENNLNINELSKKANKKVSKISNRDMNIKAFNNNIQEIKNAKETIALLKEQLKEDTGKKQKSGRFIKNKLEKNPNNNFNKQIDINSNLHNYNMNANLKRNTNKSLKNTGGITPNKNLTTSEKNKTNNNTASNNNKNISKTNNINNNYNTEFGKKMNLSSIYDNNKQNETKNFNSIYSDRPNKQNIKTREDEPEIDVDSSNDNTLNKIHINNFKQNKKNNSQNDFHNNNNKKAKYVCLQKPDINNDFYYIWKANNNNTFSLQNQYNNFHSQKHPIKEGKETRPFNHSIQKAKKQNSNIVMKKNNKSIITNTAALGYRYNTFTDEKNMTKKLSISYDENNNKNNNKKNTSQKINIIPTKNRKEDRSLIKKHSCNPKINKQKQRNNSSGNMRENKNHVKKCLTKNEFKGKSISKIGAVCIAGEVVFGEKKINQDNYFNSLLSDGYKFIGVCDGHGENGHYVSDYLVKHLPLEFQKDLAKSLSEGVQINDNLNIIKPLFISSFKRTDENLSNFTRTPDSNFDVEYSGSTCVSILLKQTNTQHIYISNVGDSRTIIIKKTINNYWTCQQLSRDHKPTEKDEAQRILEYDGEIEKIEDDEGNWTGPLRVWQKGSDGPGLAMTRSFGDEIGASVGVVSEPEVTIYKVVEEDKCIIIASDGLWEYMGNKEVTDFVKSVIDKNDAEFICKELYKESVKRWKLKDQGIDDITILCILLE